MVNGPALEWPAVDMCANHIADDHPITNLSCRNFFACPNDFTACIAP
jgi:hypothetical protein